MMTLYVNLLGLCVAFLPSSLAAIGGFIVDRPKMFLDYFIKFNIQSSVSFSCWLLDAVSLFLKGVFHFCIMMVV